MAEYPLSDPLLIALREERPPSDHEDRADSRAAVAVLDRVLSIDRFDAVAPIDSSIAPHPDWTRRRRGIAAAAAALVAGAVAFGFVFTDAASRPGTGRQSAVLGAKTVAYRTTDAITSALSSGVEQVESVVATSSGAALMTVDYWSYATSWRIELFRAGGAPTRDESTSVTNGVRSGYVVDYLSHSWFATATVPVPSSAQEIGASTVAQEIREELSAGDLTVVSDDATLNGQRAIEVSGTNPSTLPSRKALFSPAEGLITGGPASATFTIWIDPTTYLPLQRIVDLPGGATDASRVTWLPPTSDNLAQVQAPIPSGFSKVPGPTQATSGSAAASAPTSASSGEPRSAP